MRLWTETYPADDRFPGLTVWLGIGGYRHGRGHPWLGWTLQLYFFKWEVQVNWVSNYAAYARVIK
jgi:hypothetical protein